MTARRSVAYADSSVELARTFPSQSLLVLQDEVYHNADLRPLFDHVAQFEERWHGSISAQFGVMRNAHLFEHLSHNRLLQLLDGDIDIQTAKQDIVAAEYACSQLYEACLPIIESLDQWTVTHFAQACGDSAGQQLGAFVNARRGTTETPTYHQLTGLYEQFETWIIPRIAGEFTLDIPYLLDPLGQQADLCRPLTKADRADCESAFVLHPLPVDELDLQARLETISRILGDHADHITDDYLEYSNSTQDQATAYWAAKQGLYEIIQSAGTVPMTPPDRPLLPLPLLDIPLLVPSLEALPRLKETNDYLEKFQAVSTVFPDLPAEQKLCMIFDAWSLCNGFGGIKVAGPDWPVIFLNDLVEPALNNSYIGRWYRFHLVRSLLEQLLNRSHPGTEQPFRCPFCTAVVLPPVDSCPCAHVIPQLAAIAEDFTATAVPGNQQLPIYQPAL